MRQFFGQRRQHHLSSHGYQQIVLEVFAKTRQRPARGRLTQVNSLSGTSHALLGKKSIEHYEKIQIEAVQVHAGDTTSSQLRVRRKM